LQRRLVRLGVDADRIESTVAQQRGNGRQIHRFNQAPSSVVAEPTYYWGT